jgi:hypothetical protein
MLDPEVLEVGYYEDVEDHSIKNVWSCLRLCRAYEVCANQHYTNLLIF